MIELLKNTYLLNTEEIEKNVDCLWMKYQKILDNKKSSFEKLNEARAILYFLGFLYPEKIALESLERRVEYLVPKISLDDFLLIIDENNEEMIKKYKRNKKFNQLKDFYLIIKKIKMKIKNNSYLDEDRFNKVYSELRPKNYF
jgi:hypothetical protein